MVIHNEIRDVMSFFGIRKIVVLVTDLGSGITL